MVCLGPPAGLRTLDPDVRTFHSSSGRRLFSQYFHMHPHPVTYHIFFLPFRLRPRRPTPNLFTRLHTLDRTVGFILRLTPTGPPGRSEKSRVKALEFGVATKVSSSPCPTSQVKELPVGGGRAGEGRGSCLGLRGVGPGTWSSSVATEPRAWWFG